MKTPEEIAREEGRRMKHDEEVRSVNVKKLYDCIEKLVDEGVRKNKISSRGGEIEVPGDMMSGNPGISCCIVAIQQYLGMYGWYGEARGFWTGKDKKSQVYVFSLKPLNQDPSTH